MAEAAALEDDREAGAGGSGAPLSEPPHPEAAPRGSALEVFRVALRLGLTSFGGPIAHLGYFRREYVERRGWLDDAAFGDLIALCQSLPGPASSELGIAIGTRRAGIRGGFAAWLGFTAPSAIALCLFGLFTASADVSGAGWVHGLKLAAVAVVALAVWTMARSLTPDWPRRAFAVVAAAVALAWASPAAQLTIIGGGALAGLAVLRPTVERSDGAGPSVVSSRAGLLALGLLLALLLGLPVLRVVTGSEQLAFVDAFFRAGALVFGGGHLVLPLLHSTVVAPGWVSNTQFLAGYGAAQAVPGPLFTFSAFLGTVARVPPAGVAGAAIAVAAIFLPAFLLVFGVLPFWERLRGVARFRRALAGTNAAVVGLLAAALYTPIWTSAVGGWPDLAIAGVAFVLLWRLRAPPIAVVALAALAAQLVALA